MKKSFKAILLVFVLLFSLVIASCGEGGFKNSLYDGSSSVYNPVGKTLVYNANFTIESRNIQNTEKEVLEIVEKYQGYLINLKESSSGAKKHVSSCTINVGIPSNKIIDAAKDVDEAFTIVGKNIYSVEISKTTPSAGAGDENISYSHMQVVIQGESNYLSYLGSFFIVIGNIILYTLPFGLIACAIVLPITLPKAIRRKKARQAQAKEEKNE